MPVEGLDQRLDDAAHAGRHPAGQDAERELPAPQRSRPDGREPRVLGRAGRGQRRERRPARGGSTTPRIWLRCPGSRRDLPPRARKERRGEGHETLCVEARRVEAGAEGSRDVRQLASQVGFAHGSMSLRGVADGRG